MIKDNFMMKLGWNLVVQTLSMPLSGRKVHVCVCVYVRDRDTKGEEMTYDLECG